MDFSFRQRVFLHFSRGIHKTRFPYNPWHRHRGANKVSQPFIQPSFFSKLDFWISTVEELHRITVDKQARKLEGRGREAIVECKIREMLELLSEIGAIPLRLGDALYIEHMNEPVQYEFQFVFVRDSA